MDKYKDSAGENSKRRVVLLVNTSSRTGKKSFPIAREYLASRSDIALVESLQLENESFESTIEQAVSFKPDILVLGSGDGTISTVFRYLAKRNIALAILPLGTSNNYARSLKIPLALPDALENVVHGSAKRVDAARINGKYFANVASIGLSTKIARAVSPRLKRYIGRFAYAVAGAQELITHGSFECRVQTKSQLHVFQTNQVVVANGGHHAGTDIEQPESVTNGNLLIFSMDKGNRIALLLNFIRFHISGVSALRNYTVIRTPSATITTTPIRSVEVDGEILTKTPVKLDCQARYVSVIVPA